MRPVTLQFYKYPRIPHWRHEMVHLGDDSHGIWLGAPPGTTLQRGVEPSLTWNRPFVQLIQPGRPWIPIWNVDPSPEHRTAIYVDITTVPTISPDRIEAIDIDLDVVQLLDGAVQVLDEDEFNDHRVALHYPEWLVDQARATTARVVAALETRTPPFDDSHLRWFDELTQATSR